MSEFSVPVIRVGPITKHPGADKLSLAKVNGETVVFATGDFQEGDLAIYVPVDAVIPVTVPGTEFLGEHRRIKAKRLRGVYSEGLLLSANILLPQCTQVGQDVSSILGIVKHEDKVPEGWGGGGQSTKGSSEQEKYPACVPHYDIESYKKYSHLMVEGEPVVITEKLHGSQFRAASIDGKFYVGSHNHFWRDPERKSTLKELFSNLLFNVSKHRWGQPIHSHKPNLYWTAAKQYQLQEYMTDIWRGACNGLAIYAECYGQVQDLRYGSKDGQIWLRVFDVYDTKNKKWLDWHEAEATAALLKMEMVPTLYEGPFSEKILEGLVEGKSTIPGSDNIREGAVVKPIVSRESTHFGRVILKYVSQGYKLRKGPTTELH